MLKNFTTAKLLFLLNATNEIKTKEYKKKKGETHCGKEIRKNIVRRSRTPSCNVYFRFVAHKRAQFHTLVLSLAPPLHFPMRRNKCILYKTYLFYVQKRNCSPNKRLRNNRYKGPLSRISSRFGNRW